MHILTNVTSAREHVIMSTAAKVTTSGHWVWVYTVCRMA